MFRSPEFVLHLLISRNVTNCQIKLLLLQWKTMLLVFGGSKQLQESKSAICEKGDLKVDDETYITASPLDYHLFRQEITSKYPAYSPPQPLVPIELENSSILPPLSNHPSRTVSQDSLQHMANLSVNGNGRSIFNQPVHIATPAPSPPPSPAGPGGKGGKKQNYQTNQNFPFLYPPIDHIGSPLDGKTTHDTLLGDNWDGTDVPASILEAGQLFASRMRMSRSLRQLWNVREAYIKFERGWDHSKLQDDIHNLQIEGLNLDFDESASSNSGENGVPIVITPEEPNSDAADSDVHQRLDAVEEFYVRSYYFHSNAFLIIIWDSGILYHTSNLLSLCSSRFYFRTSRTSPTKAKMACKTRFRKPTIKHLRFLQNGLNRTQI